MILNYYTEILGGINWEVIVLSEKLMTSNSLCFPPATPIEVMD